MAINIKQKKRLVSKTAVSPKEIFSKSAVSPKEIFSNIADLPGAIWLDSSLSFDDRGRYSFIAFKPVAEILWLDNSVIIKKHNKTVEQKSCKLFFEQLELLTKQYEWAVGFISYEATLPFLGFEIGTKSESVPLAHFCFYDSMIVYDNINKTFLNNNYSEIITKHDRDVDNSKHKEPSKSRIKAVLSKSEYLENIEIIKNHIKEGDIYQANFTTRFDVESDASPYDVYLKLRELNPAAYSAYLNFGDYQILSSSPERMFKKDGDFITSSPIKGTIKRGKTDSELGENINKLLNSAKDKAELLMIVDLVRNDLGKIAKTGTVKVDRLYKAEVYSSLVHLVSDISAQLKTDVKLHDIFRALLPGGSITGAPKKRAVEIINSLETVPRSVYTGCVGIINNDNADFNIAIRTMTHKDGIFRLHAGGGIVADSDVEAEYDEMYLKAKNLIKALGFEQ